MVTRNRDEIGGRIEQATGVVKERLGRATGDERLEEQGAADRPAVDRAAALLRSQARSLAARQ